jgi:hypothetical protein
MARPVTRSFSSASVASFKVGYQVCKGSAPASPPVWVDQPCSTSQGRGWNAPGSGMNWQFCQSRTARVPITFGPLRSAGGLEFPV